MKLGVISDTHGQLDRTRRALEIFTDRRVDRIIHCGDIGTTAVIHLFAGPTPTDFVFGNSDPCTETLRKTIQEIGQTCWDWFGSMELEGKKIAFLHGHHSERFDQELHDGHWDLICFGHSHVPDWSLWRSTYLLNPGAVHRSPSPSIAVLELPEMNLETMSLV